MQSDHHHCYLLFRKYNKYTCYKKTFYDANSQNLYPPDMYIHGISMTIDNCTKALKLILQFYRIYIN